MWGNRILIGVFYDYSKLMLKRGSGLSLRIQLSKN
jgi:hypothetical protein